MRGDWLNWLGFGFGRGGGCLILGWQCAKVQGHAELERYKEVLIGWHCAKVKGHAELKIENPRVKTFSYDFPKLHHSKTNSLCANVHLRQSFWKTVKVTKRSCDVSPRSKYQNRRGTHGPPVPQIWCNSDYYLQSYCILKRNLHMHIQTHPSPKWKMADPRNFGPIRAFFIELSG